MADHVVPANQLDGAVLLTQMLVPLNRTNDAVELADIILEYTLQTLDQSAGAVWLYERNQILCLAQRGTVEQTIGGAQRRPLDAEPLLKQVISTAQPVFAVGDSTASSASLMATTQADSHSQSQPVAVVPLVAHDEVVGVLTVAGAQPVALEPEQRAQINTLASHAAYALYRARESAQVERQRRHIELLDRKKDEFLSIVSHELKNPMASIKGYADLMLRRSRKNPSDPNRKGLEIISQQVGRMTSMLDQLLDFSRISMDRLRLDVSRQDLVALVRQAVDELQPTTQDHQIILSVVAPTLLVECDQIRINQAISNLIGNAIKYSPNGGTIEIDVQQQHDGIRDVAYMTIRDHGIGIPRDEQDHLFERFFRASNVEDAIAGMGLGLFITREIVMRHDGSIQVESEEGAGSVFSVMLPLVAE